MNYDIKKDAKPEDTVARIKKTLDEIGIKTEVFCTGSGKNHYSLRVIIAGTEIGTNGKGTCEINALASGYAEFMERLQTEFLFTFKKQLASEEKIINQDYFKWLPVDNLKENNLIFKKTEKIIREDNERTKYDNLAENYISYKNRKSIYIPNSLSLLQHSNGFSAGNTYEEACVQALSEIIERYCARVIIANNLAIPEVSKKYYKKYDKILSLINEIENYGYQITIKDASLGKKFPVICCIIEDLRYPKNGIYIKFGAHPYFPIALERCLTEFLQGYKTADIQRKINKFKKLPNNAKLNKVACEIHNNKNVDKNNKHIVCFFKKNNSYKFNKNNWIFQEKITNKNLFNKMAKNILKYVDDIYIKNHSFLNFPVINIFIPKLSDLHIINLNFLKKTIEALSWIEFSKQKSEECANIDNLIKTCDFLCFEIGSTFSSIEAWYFGFYCSIIKQNKKNIKKFLREILRNLCFNSKNLNSDPILRLYQGYGKYFKFYFANTPPEIIREKIEKQFGSEVYNEIIRCINSFDFDYIKAGLINLGKEKEEQDKKTLEEIKEKLNNFYLKNQPEQNEILKIIDKPDIFEKIFSKLCLRQKFKL